MRNNKGQLVVLFAVAMVALIGVVGLVVDIGLQRLNTQKMKLASDSAALAGGMELPDTSRAREKALEFCSLNGYVNGENGITITTQVDPYGNDPNWYKVSINKPSGFMFGGLFGIGSKSLNTFSTAEYRTYVPIDITGGGVYGGTVDQMKFILQVKGKTSLYSQGDPISVQSLDNGSANPEYNTSGYNFKLYVPSTYTVNNGTSQVLVEVYDPDCYKTSGSAVDDGNQDITTIYSIYAPDDSPNDYSDDVLIGQGTVANNSALSEKWIQLTNSNSTNFTGTFQFNSSTYGAGNYRVNVHSTSGYGSNGFSLRAGPPRITADTSGKININPNNNSQREFYLTKPNGTQITRDDLTEDRVDYTGEAAWVHVKPKGGGTQDDLLLNGQTFELENNQTYDFNGVVMNVHLYNDSRNAQGKAMGKWWIEFGMAGGQDSNVTVTSSTTITIPFDVNNGTSVTATGKLPLRFIRAETVDITLGSVPAAVAGKKMYVKKFDTDIGSTSITYSCDSLGQTFTGVLAGNGQYKTDEITIPEGYNGGTWYAHYTAGTTDVSTWWMWYQGVVDGEAGYVVLVE